MSLPNRFDIVQAVAARTGVPPAGDDEARRAFVRRVVETLVARYPAEGWGTKRSGPGAPASKDVICTREPFEGADIQASDGSLVWHEHNAGNDPNWASQASYFFTYEPHDWLAETPVEPPQEPEPPSGDTLPAALARIEVRLAAIEAALAAAGPATAWPTFDVALGIPWIGTARGTATPRQP